MIRVRRTVVSPHRWQRWTKAAERVASTDCDEPSASVASEKVQAEVEKPRANNWVPSQVGASNKFQMDATDADGFFLVPNVEINALLVNEVQAAKRQREDDVTTRCCSPSVKRRRGDQAGLDIVAPRSRKRKNVIDEAGKKEMSIEAGGNDLPGLEHANMEVETDKAAPRGRK